ncbi:hypothetical protein CKM354_001138200 [Cercospora kikuchii]|uniref:RBR-type E3 ubiquitin transferase n=1 Tax=Cercospora kikuchii TaxID=84275 RepID=A0A9P3FL89_9PEZI|nr:uncharacterized protein CKM354_001138200 [Cercospora kikuchii]GIZ48315.1 hypothetical protein CKM354_001138200 [Cercospora kikuchii]
MSETLPPQAGTTPPTSIIDAGRTALQDYQHQLMILEEQNRQLRQSNMASNNFNPNTESQRRPPSNGSLFTAGPIRRPYPPAPPPASTRCTACGDTLEPKKMLHLNCRCAYCSTCLTHLFTRALTDETLYPPSCHLLPIDFAKARSFLPHTLLRTYRHKATELNTKNKIYCSNVAKCNAFIAPHSIHNGQAFCQKCGQATCVKCKEKEHFGPCDETKGLLAVMQMAGQKKWKACPECKRLVEKADGCNHVVCRCGTDFCYACGLIYGGCDCEEADEEDEDEYMMDEAVLENIRAQMPQRRPRRELQEDIIEDTMVAPFGWGQDEFTDR